MKGKMLKLWEKAKIFLQWYMSIVCFFGALIEMGISSLFLVVAGVLFLPLKKIRKFLLEKLNMKGAIACLVAIPFFFIGISMSSDGVDAGDSVASMNGGYSSVLGSEDESSSNQTPPATDSSSSSSQTPPATDSSGSSQTPPATDSSSSSNQTSSGANNNQNITYVLNTNTKKIHYSSCSHVKKISAANRQDTKQSLAELLAAGYTKCGTCFK